MAAAILSRYKQRIKEFTLEPSTGGCFEIHVNQELLYSKLETGSFPEEDQIVEKLEGVLA